jgi:chromosome segregation ATPase
VVFENECKTLRTSMHGLEGRIHSTEEELGALRDSHAGTCNDLECSEEECRQLKDQLRKLNIVNK